MDLPEILDVVLQYLKVLVWPGVVVTLVLAFRAQIKGVLGRLHKASGLGMNFELNKELAEDARELAETPLPDLKESPADSADIEDAKPADEVEKPKTAEPQAQTDTAEKPRAKPKAPKPKAPELERPEPKLEGMTSLPTTSWSQYHIPRERIKVHTPAFTPGRWVVDNSSIDASPWSSVRHGRIFVAWSRLEEAAHRVAEAKGIWGSRTVTDVARELHKRGLISYETLKVANDLQALYDRTGYQIVGSSWLANQTADDFENTAKRLGSIFEQVLEKSAADDDSSDHE